MNQKRTERPEWADVGFEEGPIEILVCEHCLNYTSRLEASCREFRQYRCGFCGGELKICEPAPAADTAGRVTPGIEEGRTTGEMSEGGDKLPPPDGTSITPSRKLAKPRPLHLGTEAQHVELGAT